MKKVLKVFTWIKRIFSTIFFTILIVYLSVVIVQKISGNKSVFGYRVFNVASGSMEPIYRVNDVIAVEDCDTKELKIGDDISYVGHGPNVEGRLITHRIISMEEKDGVKYITTKGVNNPLQDPQITESQVIGKVVGKIPLISTINRIIYTQVGFFFLIFCPIVLMVCLEILESMLEGKLERKELIEK